ncbi:MAG: hypothetical protein KAH33_00780 [Candidatus Delongbacteria bacterium]|nr:hypothetical protein [Candidatus Delongbacteria bacterium]
MEDSTTNRKLRAIMFTDIVGYTILMQHDETEALKLLQKHKDLVKEIVEKFGGKIIKHIGDEILIESESAVMLVYSAQELQKKLSERNASVPKSRELWVRIGIHIGDVVFQDNDIFGDGVNIAARLRPLAMPGGICVSHAVLRLLGNQNEIKTSFLGLKKLKNIDEKVKVYNVHVDTSYQPSLNTGSKKNSDSKPAILKFIMYAVLLIFIGMILYWTIFKGKYTDYELDFYRGDLLSAYEKTSGEKDLDDVKEHYFHISSATGLQGERLKQEYRKLAKKNPYCPEASFYLGLSYSLFSNSESQLDSSIFLFNTAKKKGLSNVFIDISLLNVYRLVGSKPLEAKYAYGIIKKYPDNILALTKCASTFHTLTGNSTEAIELLDKSISFFQQNYEAYFELAKVYTSKYDYKQAYTSIDSAIHIAPKNKDILSFAVELYKKNNDVRKATLILDNWPDKSPDKYIRLAQLNLYDGNPENALKHIEKGLADHHKNIKLNSFSETIKRYLNLSDSLSVRSRTTDTSVNWTSSLDVAEQMSKREDKPLLLYFSDKENISSVYIDLALTNPSIIELLGSIVSIKLYKNLNDQIAEKYNLSAFPSLVLLDGAGTVISSFENKIGNVSDVNVIRSFLSDGIDKYRSILALKTQGDDAQYKTAKDFTHAEDLAVEHEYPIMVIGSDTKSELSQKFLKETIFHPSFMSNFKEMILLTLDINDNRNFFKSFRVDKFPAVLFFNEDVSFISWKYGVQPKKILTRLIEQIKLFRAGKDYIRPEINWIYSRDEATRFAKDDDKFILAHIANSDNIEPGFTIFKDPQIVKKINADFIPLLTNIDSLSSNPMNGYEYYPMLAIMNPQGEILYRTSISDGYDEITTFLNIKEYEDMLISLGSKNFEEIFETFQLAKSLCKNKYFISAENLLVDLAMKFPHFSHLYVHVAESFLDRNKLKKALYYSSLLKKATTAPGIHDLRVIVSSYLLDNRFAELEKYMVDTKLANFRDPVVVGMIYGAMSEIEMALSNNSIAIQYAEKSIDNEKNNAEHYFHLGKLFYLKKMKIAAIKQFKIATILDPDMAKAYFYLYLLSDDKDALARAKLLYHQGNYDERSFRFIDSKFTYSQKGYTDVIQDELKNRMKLFPGKIKFEYEYAKFLSENDGNMTEALDRINNILQTDPENPLYNDTAAWVFYNLGDYSVANKLNAKALRNIPTENYNSYPDLLYHAGIIKASIGDKKSAFVFFEAFLDIENLGGVFWKKTQYAKKYIKKMNK